MKKMISAVFALLLTLSAEGGEIGLQVVNAPDSTLLPNTKTTVLVFRASAGSGGGILNKFRVRFTDASGAFQGIQLMDFGVTPPQPFGPIQPIVFDGGWLQPNLSLSQGGNYTLGVAVITRDNLQGYREKTARLQIVEVDTSTDQLTTPLPLHGGTLAFRDLRARLSIESAGETYIVNGIGEANTGYMLLVSPDLLEWQTAKSTVSNAAGVFQIQFLKTEFGRERAFFQVISTP